MPRYDLSGGPCSYCRCTATGPNTWTDFRATASWRLTRWSKETWHAWEGRSRRALLTLPGASCFTIAYDWMHTKYLGTDLYQFGSCLALLVNNILGGTAEENLQTCWSFLKRYFREHRTPTPFRYLNRISMFMRSGGRFPKLRGKASEVRHFSPALQALWEHHHNPNLAVHRQVNLMLKANCRLEELISEYKTENVFPPAVASEFEDMTTTMLQLQTQLANHFVEEGIAYFDITSKSHMLQEISLLSHYVNPRLLWAFCGEDLMQKIQQVAQSCTRGNTQGQTTIKMARHYRLGLHLLFKNQHG